MKMYAALPLNFALFLSLLVLSSGQAIQQTVHRRLGDTSVVHHPPSKPATSGGSTSGESTSGGSTSGSGSSGGTGGGSSTVTSESKASDSGPKRHLIALGMAAAAMAAAAAVVAVSTSPRQPKVEPKHSLKGAVSRRIQLFSQMAEHHENAARPPRREVEAMPATDYNLAQDGASFGVPV